MRISDWVQTCALPISRLAGLEGFDLDRGRGERGDETRLVAFLAAAANPEEIVGDQLFERGCILRGDGRIERGRRFAISVGRCGSGLFLVPACPRIAAGPEQEFRDRKSQPHSIPLPPETPPPCPG